MVHGGDRTADRGPILDSPRSALIEAMAEWANERIGGGQLFATLTWANPPHPRPGYDSIGLGRSMRDVESHLTRAAEVYPGITAFVAWEEHKDRMTPHAHGLIAGLPDSVPPAIEQGRRHSQSGGPPRPGGTFDEQQATEWMWRQWYERHGIARVEAVRDGQAVAGYAAKYCFKELGPWRIWTAGELRQRFVNTRRRNRG